MNNEEEEKQKENSKSKTKKGKESPKKTENLPKNISYQSNAKSKKGKMTQIKLMPKQPTSGSESSS